MPTVYQEGATVHLVASGKMYKADVSAFKPGDVPIQASSLAVEDIGAFVLAYPFVNNAHDSHPYNFIIGPNGDMYIADAAANVILRREKNTGALSVVAEVPGIADATPIPGGLYGPTERP